MGIIGSVNNKQIHSEKPSTSVSISLHLVLSRCFALLSAKGSTCGKEEEEQETRESWPWDGQNKQCLQEGDFSKPGRRQPAWRLENG